MKKLLSLLLAMVLLFSLALPAGAVSTLDLIAKYCPYLDYTHAPSGTVLSIPFLWKTEERDDTMTIFTASEDSPLMTMQAVDLGDPDATMSKNDLARAIGTKAGSLKTVTLGNHKYYTAQTKTTKTLQKKKVTVTTQNWALAEQGWIYVYRFTGSKKHELYDDFTAVIASASYGSAEAAPSPGTGSDVYDQAVAAYEAGSYASAQELFQQAAPYGDSSKYLRLIRIRNAGSNIGVGSEVYLKECGLTDQDKQDIDAAARDFDFADTAQVLLCNSDVACYYLVGKWNGGSKCYIHFKMNKAGGTYNIGSKLSTNYKSTFSIDDGELRVDVNKTDKLTLQLTLTGPDTMEVLTYEKDCKTYTLKRK